MNKKIIITGGSGFIGTNMVDYYISKKFQVLNIDIAPPLKKSHSNVWEKLDINDQSNLTKTFKNFDPDYIIHLAAGTGMNVSEISHFRTNFDGVKSLINSIKDLKNLKKIIFTSSLLVCKRNYTPKDDRDYKPDSLYGESKVLSEKIVQKSNILCDWAIVRPTAVWGPWFRSSYTSFFKLISRRMFVNPGTKPLKKPAVYVGNAIYMYDKILNSKKNNKEVFYITDYPDYTIQEWAKGISSKIKVQKPITLPFTFVSLFAVIGDLLKLTRINSDPPLSTFRLNNMITSTEYNLENTKSIVGNLPYDLNDGISKTINWMNLNKK